MLDREYRRLIIEDGECGLGRTITWAIACLIVFACSIEWWMP